MEMDNTQAKDSSEIEMEGTGDAVTLEVEVSREWVMLWIEL